MPFSNILFLHSFKITTIKHTFLQFTQISFVRQSGYNKSDITNHSATTSGRATIYYVYSLIPRPYEHESDVTPGTLIVIVSSSTVTRSIDRFRPTKDLKICIHIFLQTANKREETTSFICDHFLVL